MREYSLSLIWLLKGIVYSHQRDIWDNLLEYEADIKKHFSPFGLDLFLDKSEGYAYLRQREWEEETGLPALAEKRQLNFFVSLLCLLLRKYLLEQDAAGGSVRAIITEEDILHRMRMYLPSSPDEAKQTDKIYSTIKRVIEEGFLRKLEGSNDSYEVHRIIKGFINAEVIDETLVKLETWSREKTAGE